MVAEHQKKDGIVNYVATHISREPLQYYHLVFLSTTLQHAYLLSIHFLTE